MSTSTIANNNTYGFPLFNEKMPQPQIELTAYALTRGNYAKTYEQKVLHPQGMCIGDFKFERPFNHLVRAISYLWPTEVEVQVNKVINRPLLRILEELCEEDDVGVAGNASSSKSFGVSVFCVTDWLSSPENTLSFVASTSLSGSEDRIWGVVSRLHKYCRFPIGHLLDYRKMIVYEDPSNEDPQRDYSNAIKALAFEKGQQGRKAVDTTRGRKNKRVRMYVDELAEMEAYTNKVRDNLAANDDLIYVGIANPLPGENPHRDLCEPADSRGWDSVNQHSRKWKTRTGTCIFLSGEDSPNFDKGVDRDRPPFPYLLTAKKKARMLELAHGNENSLDYWRNCIGFWPLDTTETSVMTRSLIKNSDTSFEPTWTSDTKLRLATLDCGWSSGGDRNVVSYGFLANLRNSRKRVLMFTGQKEYDVDVGSVFEDSLADKIVPDLISFGVHPSQFGLDISGDGGKVMAAIIRRWSKDNLAATGIVPISSMGKPSDRPASATDQRQCVEVYDRRVTEYWFSMHNALVDRCIYGLSLDDHRDLVNELCGRQYTFRGKKISVEVKADMKSRMGRSPDRGDSATYLVEMARRNGLEFIADNKVDMVGEETMASSGYNDIAWGNYGESEDPDGF